MRVISKVITVFIFTSAIGVFAEENVAELTCAEFSSIVQFIQKNHLRFDSTSEREKATFLNAAFAETPDALRLLGYPMLAARFQQLDYAAQSEREQMKSPTQICQMLGSNLFRTAFLKGYARHLDPYSDFYLTEELDAKSSALEGEFVGVGIGTEVDHSFLRVTEVVPGGPAEHRLFVGDRISKIDGHPVDGLNDIEVRQRIRGERGTTVRFEGQREQEQFHAVITRDVVHQQSVSWNWLDGKVLQIKITRFFRQTAEQVERVVQTEGPKARGFLLDVRNNPGGLLQGARDVVNIFVPQGVVVYLKGRGIEDQVWALREGSETKKPVVVLMNGGTASAAEIVAGALQDYGRAILVGKRTYGKGSVQNIYETQTSVGTHYRGGIKLTTLWYYLPSGRSVKSLDPDVAIVDNEPTLSHPPMPYSGPDRIHVARHLGNFEMRRKAATPISGDKFHDSEEAGRAVLLKMLAGLPNQN
jgi:carboxyl-terminal processing protease